MQGSRPIWLATAALGAVAAVLAAAFGVLGFFFVLLVIPGMSRRTWLAATSGAFSGFGVTWLALMLRDADSSAGTGDEPLKLVVGIVPFALGLVLGLMAVASARRGSV